MSLAKYKRPVEYSFMVWVRRMKEDYEPVGQDYFLNFVKNVIRYNATTWQNPSGFKRRVRKELPKIDEYELDELWGKFETCLHFHKAYVYLPTLHITDSIVPKGMYLELSYEKGKFREELKPLPKI